MKKCLNCKCLITEYNFLTGMVFFSEALCDICDDSIKSATYTKAIESYPRLIKNMESKHGIIFGLTFEEYCSKKLRDLLGDVYYKKYKKIVKKHYI